MSQVLMLHIFVLATVVLLKLVKQFMQWVIQKNLKARSRRAISAEFEMVLTVNCFNLLPGFSRE